jgi:hypothetical protein
MCYKQGYTKVTNAEVPDLSLPLKPCSTLERGFVVHSPTVSDATQTPKLLNLKSQIALRRKITAGVLDGSLRMGVHVRQLNPSVAKVTWRVNVVRCADLW